MVEVLWLIGQENVCISELVLVSRLKDSLFFLKSRETKVPISCQYFRVFSEKCSLGHDFTHQALFPS